MARMMACLREIKAAQKQHEIELESLPLDLVSHFVTKDYQIAPERELYEIRPGKVFFKVNQSIHNYFLPRCGWR